MRTAHTHDPKSSSDKQQRSTDRPFSVLDIEEEELAPAISDVRSAIEQDRRGSLEACYRIGLAIDKHYRRLVAQTNENNREERGERYFDQLGEQLEVQAWWLRNHFRLVQTYDADEFVELCQTPGMTATKALQLAGVTEELRAELVEKVASEGLTVLQVEAAIKEAIGPRRQPGAGRPPKRPKKLQDAFVHLTKQAEQFVRINNSVWFGDDYDIAAEIKELPMDKVTDKLKAQIIDAAAKCEALAATATKDAEALRELLPEIDHRMANQARVNAKLEAEVAAEDQQTAA